jgi:hypothetical protein
MRVDVLLPLRHACVAHRVAVLVGHHTVGDADQPAQIVGDTAEGIGTHRVRLSSEDIE